jgi:hypothetical protein
MLFHQMKSMPKIFKAWIEMKDRLSFLRMGLFFKEKIRMEVDQEHFVGSSGDGGI